MQSNSTSMKVASTSPRIHSLRRSPRHARTSRVLEVGSQWHLNKSPPVLGTASMMFIAAEENGVVVAKRLQHLRGNLISLQGIRVVASVGVLGGPARADSRPSPNISWVDEGRGVKSGKLAPECGFGFEAHRRSDVWSREGQTEQRAWRKWGHAYGGATEEEGWPMEYSVYIELPPGAETTSGSSIHCFGCKMRHILCDDKLLRVDALTGNGSGRKQASTRCEGKTRRVHYWLVTRKHQQ